jgi:hypothetical protein
LSQSIQILRELADLIVNASYEQRDLSQIEHEYFDVMFEKALKLAQTKSEID